MDGILQGRRERFLRNDGLESVRAVLSGRNYVVFHYSFLYMIFTLRKDNANE
jgi:hypothetical protein